MKKISLLLIITMLLTSCSLFNKAQDDDITKAKQEMLGDEVTQNNTGDIQSPTDETTDPNEETTTTEVAKNEPTAISTPLTSGDPLIEIEDLSNKDFYAGEFYINGKTLGNVDKIEVSFSNENSSYPEDLFKLKQFKIGDKNFKYMASSNFKTLDFGLNKYIFTAYSGESTYKVKVEINIPEKEVKNTTSAERTTLSNQLLQESDIKNLKIVSDENVGDLNCGNLTDYLISTYGYSYRNSCFPIIKDKSIGFYVLRLEGDKYYYEKHYIDYEKKTYGILLLETGTGVTKDSMKVKNYELKEISFDETLKADSLFKN